MRRRIVAGNWKMNKTVPEATQLAQAVVESTRGAEAEVVICPSYVCLVPVRDVIRDSHVRLGAQDLHWVKSGAYTGKVSAEMLVSAGVSYVIVGHSEQRTYFFETDQTVNAKVKAALDSGLLPIICVGERLEQREAGQTESVVAEQIRGAYAGLARELAARTVIAYEPVWAIGTGKNATPEQAQQAHAFIRRLLSELYDPELAGQLRIQYGGSVTPDNARSILSQPDVDGALVGGASLKAESFREIVLA